MHKVPLNPSHVRDIEPSCLFWNAQVFLASIFGSLEKREPALACHPADARTEAPEYARYADDMVILIDAERRSDWLVNAIDRRLREEFAKLRVAINEDKSRVVDLKKGESYTFLGFEYRRVLSLQRKWRPYYAPKLKKRTALFEKLREVFRQHVSWPVETVIARINPILRGWVNYFRVGHSSICFGVVKRWVEEKVRRHLMRARGRKGFGWTRGVANGYMTGWGCLMTTGSFDGQVRMLPQHDRPHNSWHEANRCAQCGKSARWVRCGGGWKRIHGLATEALPEETGSNG
jgi:RNA-directed DNA polymerase